MAIRAVGMDKKLGKDVTAVSINMRRTLEERTLIYFVLSLAMKLVLLYDTVTDECTFVRV